MANRIILNNTSYHGKGAIKEIPNIAKTKGFLVVASSPLTRSSHHAGDDFAKLKAAREADFRTVQESETLTQEQLSMERIMLALRTSSGINRSHLEAGCDSNALARAFSEGNLTISPDGNVRIPEDRFFISDSIISDII